MRDITSECIEFKNYCSFLSFGDELWSGAKDRWKEADEDTRIAVWDRVKDFVDASSCDGEIPSMTQINDLIWFDCDDLFYPPSFTVKVYRADENGERDTRFEPLYEETFDGISAEQDARDWWEDRKNADDQENFWDWTGEVVAFLYNETDDSEEEL